MTGARLVIPLAGAVTARGLIAHSCEPDFAAECVHAVVAATASMS
jgi:hypothetical protein